MSLLGLAEVWGLTALDQGCTIALANGINLDKYLVKTLEDLKESQE